GIPLAAICIVAAAALAGFLVLNWPPARIFMGDGGALFIGAVLASAVVLLAGRPHPDVPLAAPLLVMGTFLWDATYTILFRIVRREDWLHPHRRHLFQRLVLAGWSHSAVRRLYFALALGMATAGPLLTRGSAPAQLLLVLLGTTGCLSIVLFVAAA